MSRTVPARGALVAWACLTVAIVAEVVGTSFMAHAARDGGWTGYLVMAGALALSYFFLAQSVRRIAVGVAYAVWEGLGLTLLTVVGLTVFGESPVAAAAGRPGAGGGRHRLRHSRGGTLMNTLALFFVICSALIDVAANMMVAKSEGFRRWRWGVGAIVMVWMAFALLGQAVRYMDLATAYAMWGAIGVIGTATCGRLLFGNRLRPIGWVGIALVTVAVLLLSTAK